MGRPKSVTRATKDGVKFVSNVDQVQYDINELSRSALRDVGKVLRTFMMRKGRKLPGLKNFKIKRIPHAFQYWVRKYSSTGDNVANLWIGSKHKTWYGDQQEFGEQGQPKRGIIKNTTMEHLDDIQKIEAKYLSAIEDERKAKRLIDENEEGENEDG